MDKHISIPLPSAPLKVTGARADVHLRVSAPKSRRSRIPRTAEPGQIPASCQALAVTPRACSAPAPPSPSPSAPAQARPAPPPQPGTGPAPPPRGRLSGPPAPSRAPHRSPGAARPHHASPPLPELAPPRPRPLFRSTRGLPGFLPRAVSSPWQRGVYTCVFPNARVPAAGLAFAGCLSDGRRERATGRNYLDKTFAVKALKYRQNGKFQVVDSKEKVMIEPNETMSEKDISSKYIENKVSLKNTESRVSSKSIGNKDTETNLQSKLWSSSSLKESTGELGKDEVIAKQEKSNEYCLRDIDDKLSKSTDDDGEEDINDEKSEDSNPNKDTHAPLELMAEFLRAEMGQDYHLARKLCQRILLYEPENPEAKEFLSLIDEMLLMEKAQKLEEDADSSEGSGESDGESSEELSEEGSGESEDG